MLLFTFLLGFILHFSSSQNIPISPCPNVLVYENIGTQWVGKITAENPPPYGSVMNIKIKMSLPAQLPSQYVGKIEPADSSNVIIQKIQQNYPITYLVYFPLLYPLPNFVSIDFDDRIICSGPPAIGSYITTIDLDYKFTSGSGTVTRSPISSAVPISIGPEPPNSIGPAPPISIPDPIRAPQYPTYTSPPRQSIFNDISSNGIDTCGIAIHAVALISGGDDIARGEFPWLTAFHRYNKKEFFCAGSLITNRHILTASHCMVLSNGETRSPDDFLVKLGAHSLKEWTEKHTEIIFPSRVVTRPDYDTRALYNDIAVVFLSSVVSFNEYIRPVCLWSGSDDQSLIVGNKGTVVGWGLDENLNLLKDGPRKVELPIVSAEECKASHLLLHERTTANNLCAGARDGTGPCKGDSGGGLYMIKDQKWTIRGIVSFSVGHDTKKCDLYQYVAYTDVAKYIPWILETTNR